MKKSPPAFQVQQMLLAMGMGPSEIMMTGWELLSLWAVKLCMDEEEFANQARIAFHCANTAFASAGPKQ
jgi:hypothetical protein